jgi:hypothetical protein
VPAGEFQRYELMGMRTSLLAPALLLPLIGAAGCGSSATTSTATAPSSVSRCSVTVTGDGQVPAQGGNRTFTVAAARECAWTASVDGAWLTIRTGGSGQGDGTVEVAATANPDPQVRRGGVVLNEQRVEVTQAAADCRFTLSDPSKSFGQSGGSGAFDVRASSSLCPWTAATDVPWITLRSGASGKGTAAVEFDVAAMTGGPRSATITAAGLRFGVTQAAACSYTAAPRAQTVPTSGGVVTITVTTASDCPWTATSSDPWIGIAGPASFVGPGTVAFNVAAISGPARTGTVIVAGQPVTISQGAACSFGIAPDQYTAANTAGSVAVTITAPPGCAWPSSASQTPWITLAAPGGASGTGVVQVTIGENTGAARVGTATIAGRTLTVSQAGPPCSFRVDPLEIRLNEDGRFRGIDVKTAQTCGWTAASNAPWIIVLRGATGTGDGEVWLWIDQNRGAERSGTVIVAGQTVTVTQRH